MKPLLLIPAVALLSLSGCATYSTYDSLGAGYYSPAPSYTVSTYGYAPAYVPPPVYVRPAPYYYGGIYYRSAPYRGGPYHGGYGHYHGHRH